MISNGSSEPAPAAAAASSLPAKAAASSSPSPASIASYSSWREHQANKKRPSDAIIPFPIFCVAWLPLCLQPDAPSSHRGTILFGGGGGKKGTGVESGVVVCSALSTAASAAAASSASSASSSSPIELLPVGFLSTHDAIVMHLQPHPLFRELSAAMGSGSAIVQCDDSRHELRALQAVQTDWSREQAAQSQAVSPSGDLLATGGEDRVIRLWRYSDLELLAVAGGEADRHRDMVLSLDFSADGSLLASCGGDGSLKLWDVAALHREMAAYSTSAAASSRPASSAASPPADGHAALSAPLLCNVTLRVEKGQSCKFQGCRFVGGVRLQMQETKEAEQQNANADEKTTEAAALRRRRAAGGDAVQPRSSASASAGASPFSSSLPEQLIAIANLVSRTKPANRLISVLIPPRRTSAAAASASSSASPAAALAALPDPPFPILHSTSVGRAQLIQLAACPPLSASSSSASPPPPVIAVADNDGAVFLYSASASAFSLLSSHPRCHNLPATGLAFSPCSRYLVSASADRTFRFFDVDAARRRGGQGGGSDRVMLLLLLLLLLCAVTLAALLWSVGDTTEERLEALAAAFELTRRWLFGSDGSVRRRH